MEGRVGEGHTGVLHAMGEAHVLAAPNWFLASSFSFLLLLFWALVFA